MNAKDMMKKFQQEEKKLTLEETLERIQYEMQELGKDESLRDGSTKECYFKESLLTEEVIEELKKMEFHVWPLDDDHEPFKRTCVSWRHL